MKRIKKWFLTAGCLALAGAIGSGSPALAATGNIFLVTDRPDLEEGSEGLGGYLRSLGYDVTTNIGTGGENEYRVMDAGKAAHLETFDLVIIHRATDSGQFNTDAAERQMWNNLNVPLMLGSAFLSRESRWNWLPGDQSARAEFTEHVIVDATHPIVAGLGAGMFTEPRNLNSANSVAVGNGKLIAQAPESGATIAVWEDPGGAPAFFQGATGETHVNLRVLFTLHNYHEAGAWGDISENGKQLIAQAVQFAKRSVTADSPPAFGEFAPVSGATFYNAADGLSFRVTTQDPGGIPTSGITMTLNGENVTSSLDISGEAQNRQVAFSALQPETSYTAVITVTDASGRERVATLLFDTRTHFTLPSDWAFPLDAAKTDTAGLVAKVVQAHTFSGTLPNTEARAEAQLAGTLIDTFDGSPYANDAFPGPHGGLYHESVINWNMNAEGLGAEIGSFQAPNFPDAPIPGIPGFDNHFDNIAAEVLAYLELPAGLHTFGVNSDDGFVLWAGYDHRDALAAVLGRFDGGRGSADTIFRFNVNTPGIYPFRLLWYQGSGGANLEFFSVDADTGQKILINDRANPNAIKAWREVTAPRRSYVTSVSPRNNARGVPLDSTFSMTIQDNATQVQTGSVAMTLNGQTVNPTVSKAAGLTTISFAPAENLAGNTTNRISVTFSDNASPANVRTVTSSFVTVRAPTVFNGFTMIDNFEGGTLGDLNGRFEWSANGAVVTVDPQNPNNQVAGFIGGSGDRGTHIPATLPDGATGTLFYRLKVATDNSDLSTPVLNWSVGMSDVEITGNGAFGDYESQMNQNRDAGNELPEEIRIRDAGTFVSLEPLQPAVWYKLWMVIDNQSDTTQVYMQGGQFETQTLLQAADGTSTFTFRNSGGGPVANDLIRFFVRLAGSHAGSLYLDDIWLDATKQNLADPSAFQPEPPVDPVDVLLGIARSENNVTLSWSAANSENYVLESSNALPSTNWTPVTTPPMVSNGQKTVTEPISESARFYRLRRP
jgi:hypothetical protein